MEEKCFRKVKAIKVYFNEILLIANEGNSSAVWMRYEDPMVYIEPGLGIYINMDYGDEIFYSWNTVLAYHIEHEKEIPKEIGE